MPLGSRLGSSLVQVASLGAAVAADLAIWREYYGGGPPYYARSTNMDKWSNPLPLFITVNLLAIALCIAAAVWHRRATRKQQRTPKSERFCQ